QWDDAGAPQVWTNADPANPAVTAIVAITTVIQRKISPSLVRTSVHRHACSAKCRGRITTTNTVRKYARTTPISLRFTHGTSATGGASGSKGSPHSGHRAAGSPRRS